MSACRNSGEYGREPVRILPPGRRGEVRTARRRGARGRALGTAPDSAFRLSGAAQRMCSSAPDASPRRPMWRGRSASPARLVLSTAEQRRARRACVQNVSATFPPASSPARPCTRPSRSRRRRLPPFARPRADGVVCDRRRLDDRPRQGDRAPHRCAAARHPHHLCRLGDDADHWRNGARREEDADDAEGPAGGRDLRRRADAFAAARLSATSGMNAMAHAVEALYARDGNPIVSLMAEEGLRALAASLPGDRAGSRPTCRRARERPVRRVALRHVPRRGRHGAAPQALPCARRRRSTCRTPRRMPSCCRMRSPTIPPPRLRRWRASREPSARKMRHAAFTTSLRLSRYRLR